MKHFFKLNNVLFENVKKAKKKMFLKYFLKEA